MKKLAVIGKGTAGALSAAHFRRFTDWEIDWYFDPNIPPQPVGEGSTTQLPRSLLVCLDMHHEDMLKVDGTIKLGVRKIDWTVGGDFVHHFEPPSHSYHFHAGKLQEEVARRLSGKVSIIAKNVSPEEIDADYIMDCSGKPSDYSGHHLSDFIAVNAVHVTQCYWDGPRFNYTLAIAARHGWVFGIPLQNRCSVGYLYNHNITTLDEVKSDVREIFERFGLVPSEDTNSFNFKNYYAKKNFDGRVVRNGNSSFFLEPMEAASIGIMDWVSRSAYDYWLGNKPDYEFNRNYLTILSQTEQMIMLHYLVESPFKTKFWEFANHRAEACLKKWADSPDFLQIIRAAKLFRAGEPGFYSGFGTWPVYSFNQNIKNLGLDRRLYSL